MRCLAFVILMFIIAIGSVDAADSNKVNVKNKKITKKSSKASIQTKQGVYGFQDIPFGSTFVEVNNKLQDKYDNTILTISNKRIYLGKKSKMYNIGDTLCQFEFLFNDDIFYGYEIVSISSIPNYSVFDDIYKAFAIKYGNASFVTSYPFDNIIAFMMNNEKQNNIFFAYVWKLNKMSIYLGYDFKSYRRNGYWSIPTNGYNDIYMLKAFVVPNNKDNYKEYFENQLTYEQSRSNERQYNRSRIKNSINNAL